MSRAQDVYRGPWHLLWLPSGVLNVWVRAG